MKKLMKDELITFANIFEKHYRDNNIDYTTGLVTSISCSRHKYNAGQQWIKLIHGDLDLESESEKLRQDKLLASAISEIFSKLDFDIETINLTFEQQDDGSIVPYVHFDR